MSMYGFGLFVKNRNIIEKGEQSVLELKTGQLGRKNCCIDVHEDNIIETGSFNRLFER